MNTTSRTSARASYVSPANIGVPLLSLANITPATGGIEPPMPLKDHLDAESRKNVASPQGVTWTVPDVDVDAALTWLTGTHAG